MLTTSGRRTKNGCQRKSDRIIHQEALSETPSTIEYLSDIAHKSDAAIRARYGGKALGLARVQRTGGLDVPPTLCISTEHFVRVVRDAVNAGVKSLDELRGVIRDAEPSDHLLDWLGDEIPALFDDDPFAQSDDRRLAVRSSAVAEDSTAHSYAGQFESTLDVPTDPDAIWAALRDVWVGTFDIDVLTYASRIRVDADPPQMAALIQPMVDADRGGVLFTRDPTFGKTNNTERRQTPVVTVADSPEAAVSGGEGTTWRLEQDDTKPAKESSGRSHPEVPDELADTLRHAARHLEREERWRDADGLDVEWAVTEKRPGESNLWCLQCRPMTGGGNRSEESDAPRVWSNANVGEALPGVATPFTWSIIESFSRRGFEQAFGAMSLVVPDDADLVGSFRGRVYLNLTEFVDIASGLPFLNATILYQMAGGGGVELLEDNIDVVPSAEFVASLPATLPKIAASQLSMPVVGPVWMRYFNKRVREHFSLELDDLDLDELRGELADIDTLFDRNGRIMLSASSNFLMAFVAMQLFARWFAREDVDVEVRELVGALDVSSAEPGLELLDLARRIRRHDDLCDRLRQCDPPEAARELKHLASGRTSDGTFVAEKTASAARDLLEAIENFREQFGHRAPGEAELSTPRWREDVEFVWRVLLGYLRADDLPDRSAMKHRQREQKKRARATIEEAFPPGLKDGFEMLWHWTRHAARVRESLRDRVVESLDLYRSIALEIGRRMVRRGRLHHRDQVFYLRHDEMVDFLEHGRGDDGGAKDPGLPFVVRALVRSEICRVLRQLPDPPNTFVESGNELLDVDEYKHEYTQEERPVRSRKDASQSDRIVEGLAGHVGRVEGRARVVTDPEQADLQPGEILVAPRADVGWTPLFLTASAVVMELGGPLSHACIVAREYGIPTVVNAEGIIDLVETGDHLVVDATHGRVHINT